jgi:probable HAF family extracellular repeat protein
MEKPRVSRRFSSLGGFAACASTLAACLLLGLVPSCLAQNYSVTDLGTLPGGMRSVGLGINEEGQVVGFSDRGVPGFHAFLFNGGSMMDLGTLGGSNSAASGINSLGQITGSADTASSGTHAFIFSKGVMQDLGTLPGGISSTGAAINASGQITGASLTSSLGGVTPTNVSHAFVYNNGIMQDIGYDDLNSEGHGINNAAQVTGKAETALMLGSETYHAVLFGAGTVTDLGTIGNTRGNSSGQAINAAGDVTGGSDIASTASGAHYHAFLYNGTLMKDLGTLDATCDFSLGSGINDLQEVVGYSEAADTEQAPSCASTNRAFLYTATNGMLDLNTQIPSDSGWTLNSANGINNSGQIAGFGTIGGETHAFLLTPVPNRILIQSLYGLINPILGCVACQGILRNLVEQIPENIEGLTASQRGVLVVRVVELITIVDLFRIAGITPADASNLVIAQGRQLIQALQLSDAAVN